MPKMDGYQFIMERKKNEEWNDTPVIVLTVKKEMGTVWALIFRQMNLDSGVCLWILEILLF